MEQRAKRKQPEKLINEFLLSVVLSAVLSAPSFFGALLFALSFHAQAQEAKKVPRIGMVLSGSLSSDRSRNDAFRQGLHELGYVEGQNIVIEYRYAEGKLDRVPALVAELARLKVDVIVVQGTLPALAAKRHTSTIPIVMAHVGDPVARGIIVSLARRQGATSRA